MDILITQKAGTLDCDFESMKMYLEEKLDEYRGIVFTEDSKKEAKACVAELRKQKKAFEDRVRDAKREYLKPWESFNEKAQELIVLFNEPIAEINAQITDFENKRIEEKKIHISELYMQVFGKEPILELTTIYNSKWENATAKDSTILADMRAIRDRAQADIEVIKKFGSDVEEKAIGIYQISMNLGDAIDCINRYEEAKKNVLEQQKEETAQAIEEAKAEAIESFIPDDNGEETEEYTYVIHLTPSAKETLEMYMDSVGIEYGELTF